MLIDLKSIPIGGVFLRGEESPEIMDLSEQGIDFNRPIQYDLKVSIAGRTLLARGRLQTAVHLSCSRCLTEFDEILLVEDFYMRKEIDDPGATIDLTEEVRADIILALPVKPLCKSDCKGICPICGQDLNMVKCGCSADHSDSPFAGINLQKQDMPRH